MKLFKDYVAFTRVTGRITDNDRLEPLGLYPCTRLGQFEPEQLQQLITFCQSNPRYHIISIVNRFLFVNKVRNDAWAYYLGDGDKTEDFFYSEGAKCAFISEIPILDMHQSLSMISDCEGTGNPCLRGASCKSPISTKKL